MSKTSMTTGARFFAIFMLLLGIGIGYFANYGIAKITTFNKAFNEASLEIEIEEAIENENWKKASKLCHEKVGNKICDKAYGEILEYELSTYNHE